MEYKRHSEPWIEDVPSEWHVKKLKYMVSLRNVKASEKDIELPYIGLENIEPKVGTIISIAGEMQEVEGSSTVFCKGDVLFGKLRPYLAKCINPNFDGRCTSELLVLEAKEDNVIPKFLQFQLLSDGFIDVVNSSTYGAKMPRANWEFIGNLKLMYPDNEKQTTIVRFLDQKTSEINDLIADKEKLVALLQEQRQAIITEAVTKGLNPNIKMKESGIEWIGEIPEHWEVIQFKYLGRILGGYAFNSGDFTGEGVRVLKISNIQVDAIDWEDSSYLPEDYYDSYKKFAITRGSLVFALTRPIISGGVKVAYLDPNGEKILANQRTGIFVPNTAEINEEFLHYVSQGDYFYHEFANRLKTTNQPNISTEDIATIPVLLPSMMEQERITDYLDNQTTAIGEALLSIQTRIQNLKDYRQSLIAEAVTGKIDVRYYSS